MNISAFFDQQAAYFLTRRTCLMRDQLHAENLLGVLFDLVHGFGHFHTAAFTATTGVNLCFDHPDRAAQCFGGF